MRFLVKQLNPNMPNKECVKMCFLIPIESDNLNSLLTTKLEKLKFIPRRLGKRGNWNKK